MTTTIAAIIYGVCFGGTGLFILHFLEKNVQAVSGTYSAL